MSKKASAKMARYRVKAQMKLTKATTTPEPQNIIDSKLLLKSTKQFTTDVQDIVHNLYLAQNDESTLLTRLFKQLTTINILNDKDKFAIFLFNVGKVTEDFQKLYESYLINMNNHLIDPLNSFNNNNIKNCQSLKIKLKTAKGQYDLNQKNDNKSLAKLHKLSFARNEFIDSVKNMEIQKNQLLTHFKLYFDGYSKLVNENTVNIRKQNKNNNMYSIPTDDDLLEYKLNNIETHSIINYVDYNQQRHLSLSLGINTPLYAVNTYTKYDNYGQYLDILNKSNTACNVPAVPAPVPVAVLGVDGVDEKDSEWNPYKYFNILMKSMSSGAFLNESLYIHSEIWNQNKVAIRNYDEKLALFEVILYELELLFNDVGIAWLKTNFGTNSIIFHEKLLKFKTFLSSKAESELFTVLNIFESKEKKKEKNVNGVMTKFIVKVQQNSIKIVDNKAYRELIYKICLHFSTFDIYCEYLNDDTDGHIDQKKIILDDIKSFTPCLKLFARVVIGDMKQFILTYLRRKIKHNLWPTVL